MSAVVVMTLVDFYVDNIDMQENAVQVPLVVVK